MTAVVSSFAKPFPSSLGALAPKRERHHATARSASSLATAALLATSARTSTSERPVERPVMTPVLWMLVVAQLNPGKFDYTVADIAPLCNLKDHSLRDHCRALWPDYEGHYKLSFEEAAVLIYRVCRDGHKVPSVEHLLDELLQAGVITKNFPCDFPRVKRAGEAIIKDRETRAAQREQQGA